MEGLQLEDHAHDVDQNALQKHFHQRLGKPSDHGQKTPMRPGLGLVVNESKTPGAKSLQGFASTRKIQPSAKKEPINFEIFEDKEERAEPEPPCSPIDGCNRCDSHDSLAADMLDDVHNYGEQLTELHSDCSLLEELDQLDEIDELSEPIEPASRIPVDECKLPLLVDDFHHYNDVVLEEGDRHHPEFEHVERSHRQWAELDVDQLLAELDAIVAEQGY